MQKTKPMFEQLEARILLSATPAPEVESTAAVHAQAEVEQIQQTEISINQILIIDPAVDNYSELIQNLDSTTEIFVLDSTKDGIAQISDLLAHRSDISSLHILSHGNNGSMQLGNTVLTADNISSYQSQLSAWSASFSADADILIYACNTGQDNTLINSISELTKTDVAASDDITGLGGDAELEVEIGAIETAELFSQLDYESAAISLATETITSAVDQTQLQAAITIALAGADAQNPAIVKFNSTTDITIAFTSQIDISDSITFVNIGEGKVTFDGGGTTRLFNITGSADVYFDNLTFTGANNSAIAATDTSTVTINNSTLKDNSADQGGAIHLSGTATLSINDSNLTGNNSAKQGGALYILAKSTVTITNTRFSANTSTNNNGAAIHVQNGGTINILNSTLVDSDSTGKELIYVRQGNINLTNTTLMGSSSAALISLDQGSYSITDSTLYAQDGQKALRFEWGYGRGTITNSIIIGENDLQVAKTATYTWYSGEVLSGTGNITSTFADLKLAPLADNGGPVQTMALGTGAVAIDAGTGTTADARGANVFNGSRDIGAFEYRPNSLPVVNPHSQTTTIAVSTSPVNVFADNITITDHDFTNNTFNNSINDTITNITVTISDYETGDIFAAPSIDTDLFDVYDNGDGTIIISSKAGLSPSYDNYITALNTLTYKSGTTDTAGDRSFTVATAVQGTVVNFSQLKDAIANASDNDIIVISSSIDLTVVFAETLTIDKNLIFVNNGTKTVTFDGDNSQQLFNITGAAIVSFDNFTFTKASNSAIAASGTSTVTINNSTLKNNSAIEGGAIYLSDTAALFINDSNLTENTATGIKRHDGGGGVLYIEGRSTVTITNTSFSNNSSAFRGGAIEALEGANINIINSTLVDLDSSSQEFIYVRKGNIHLTNTTLMGSSDAALIALDESNYTITDSTLYAQNTQESLANKYKNPSGTITNSIIIGEIGSGIRKTATYTWYSEEVLTGDGNISSTVDLLKLGALADNGGPVQTMALGVGSTAINAGTGTGKDARGTDILGTKDIGAFEAANTAPTVDKGIQDKTVIEGNALNFTVPADAFVDADNDTLTYSATLEDGSALTWLAFDSVNKTFTGNATSANIGTITVKVTASDATDSAFTTFDIVVSAIPNALPTDIAITAPDSVDNVDENVGGAKVATLSATDADDTVFTYELVSGDDTNDADNALFQIVGSELKTKVSGLDFETEYKAEYKIFVEVTDAKGGKFTKALTVGNFLQDVNDVVPVITESTLTLNEGQTVTITTAMINATDGDATSTADTDITFTVSDVTNGSFQLNNSDSKVFTLADIKANIVTFVHDGSESAPTFKIAVTDGTNTVTAVAATAASFTLVNDNTPTITTKSITINRGATVDITTAMINATDADTDTTNSQLTFTVITTNATFKLNGSAVTAFSLQDIIDGNVKFVHDGTENEPTFTISISDGPNSVDATAGDISYIKAVNDVATFSGTIDGSRSENANTATSGTVIVNDADANQSSFKAGFTFNASESTAASAIGTFAFDQSNGQWTYTVDEANTQYLKDSETLVEVFTIKSADGTSQDITVTVNGSDDAATFSGRITESTNEDADAAISGTVIVNDSDANESSFIAGFTLKSSTSPSQIGTFT
ncbi:MAG: DUF4347 domain-containing protein, partial [Lentisphaeraceae bacterium]|nr:DUF4347 domain-containing protein [Lentisphaeraceae bacterium]